MVLVFNTCMYGLVFITVILTADGKRFRSDYKYYSEVDGWLKLHSIPANWHEARLRCTLEGAVLASPLDEHFLSTMKAVTVNKVPPCGIYTGVHAIFSRGDYFSIDGVPLSKMAINWAPDEPDNYGNEENCIVLSSNGTTADVNCSEIFPYLCYKKKTKSMVVNGCGTVDNDYTLDARTGSCYKFHRVARNWTAAFMACSAEGGHLAIVNSDVEAQVIKEIFAKNPANTIIGNIYKDVAHSGFHDWGDRGILLTIHGETLKEAGYEKWSPGQPDNATTGQSCGGIFRTGLLADLDCDAKRVFICEKSPDSLVSDEGDI